ncbi:YccT family protein [Photobacterium lipolyticum]|uniref:UPF0319 protein C9I89_02680 n=1 Tax=Photobacterium lipolyticum TaxID=266810 RepID=A0A2T3N596_9GAMM|nr:DUF2057 domain-containing protein [Photobacterium lipolyticum]PSW07630.1 hypothetical protein C9I89_02680 [Photobacterium lipolyticum]
MKIKQIALATMLLPFAPIAAAQVTMEIPKGIQLLVINGQDTDYSMFGFDHKPEIKLPDGANQVVFRIAKVVRDAGSKTTKFKSVPIVIRFDGDNTQLTLDIPNIQTLDEGRNFNSAPSFTIKESGNDYPFVYDTLYVGFDLAPDFTRKVEKYNKSGAIASINAGISTTNTITASVAQPQKVTSKAATQSTTNTTTPAQLTESNKAEMMLQHWFHQADDKTKKKFLSWAVTNIN